jgi:hypothetical protein
MRRKGTSEKLVDVVAVGWPVVDVRLLICYLSVAMPVVHASLDQSFTYA